jgi:hypothetical protein
MKHPLPTIDNSNSFSESKNNCLGVRLISQTQKKQQEQTQYHSLLSKPVWSILCILKCSYIFSKMMLFPDPLLKAEPAKVS